MMFYQKQTTLTLYLILISMFLSTFSFAQMGMFDVQFTNIEIDCEAETLCFDIEIKASAPDTEFFVSNINIRFGFSTNLDNPSIEQELDIAGFIESSPGPMGFSLYSPHNLIGSLDTVVSYNTELSGGDGFFLTTDYVGLGSMCLDILDFSEPVTLTFFDSATFPSTFVGENEVENGIMSDAEDGTYINYEQDISDVCNVTTPPMPDEVPTLGEWGLIMLALLMCITAVAGIRNRTVAKA